MTDTSSPAGRTQLTPVWRRTLVAVSAAGFGALLLISILAPPAPIWGLGSVGVGALLLCCGWLLHDTLWPWWGEEELSAAERAHADATLRRSYLILFAAAVGMLIYLQVRPGATTPRESVDHSLLWGLVVMVIVLPMAVSAWTYPADPARAVDPPTLLVRRLTGSDARVHIATLIAFATAALVLVAGVGMGGASGVLARAAGITGLVVVIALALFITRQLIARERRRGDGGAS